MPVSRRRPNSSLNRPSERQRPSNQVGSLRSGQRQFARRSPTRFGLNGSRGGGASPLGERLERDTVCPGRAMPGAHALAREPCRPSATAPGRLLGWHYTSLGGPFAGIARPVDALTTVQSSADPAFSRAFVQAIRRGRSGTPARPRDPWTGDTRRILDDSEPPGAAGVECWLTPGGQRRDGAEPTRRSPPGVRSATRATRGSSWRASRTSR